MRTPFLLENVTLKDKHVFLPLGYIWWKGIVTIMLSVHLAISLFVLSLINATALTKEGSQIGSSSLQHIFISSNLTYFLEDIR